MSRKQIKDLVQLLLENGAPVIYANSIARHLNCPVEMVESELYLLAEEGEIQPVYELRCYLCKTVIATAEDPKLFTAGKAVCPGCWTQAEAIFMNSVESAFVPVICDECQ